MDVTLPPDMQELHKTINDRLNAGIRKSFTPCPLIGPNWLQYFPNGNPADFRFFGVRKLAKAIGKPADAIMAILMKNVTFEGIDIDIRLHEGVFIDIDRKTKTQAAGLATSKPKAKTGVEGGKKRAAESKTKGRR